MEIPGNRKKEKVIKRTIKPKKIKTKITIQ